MGRLEVQGLVSAATGEPLVQFRQLSDDDRVEAQWQASPLEAREMAQQTVEAAMNAVYDAALYAWARENWPDDPGLAAGMLDVIRRYRADTWGMPDRPDDWRSGG
jgi:hypothetical protein